MLIMQTASPVRTTRDMIFAYKHSMLLSKAETIASSLNNNLVLSGEGAQEVVSVLGSSDVGQIVITDAEGIVLFNSGGNSPAAETYALFPEIVSALSKKHDERAENEQEFVFARKDFVNMQKVAADTGHSQWYIERFLSLRKTSFSNPSSHFAHYADLSDPDRFTDYVSQVEKAALYDTGLTASPGDELLTLSTCSYHVTDGRFVVVAKQVG